MEKSYACKTCCGGSHIVSKGFTGRGRIYTGTFAPRAYLTKRADILV